MSVSPGHLNGTEKVTTKSSDITPNQPHNETKALNHTVNGFENFSCDDLTINLSPSCKKSTNNSRDIINSAISKDNTDHTRSPPSLVCQTAEALGRYDRAKYEDSITYLPPDAEQ